MALSCQEVQSMVKGSIIPDFLFFLGGDLACGFARGDEQWRITAVSGSWQCRGRDSGCHWELAKGWEVVPAVTLAQFIALYLLIQRYSNCAFINLHEPSSTLKSEVVLAAGLQKKTNLLSQTVLFCLDVIELVFERVVSTFSPAPNDLNSKTEIEGTVVEFWSHHTILRWLLSWST